MPPPPPPPPSALTEASVPVHSQLAFGRRAVPKLTEEVASDDADVRNKAVATIATLSHDPLNVSEGVACGLIQQLLKACKRTDPVTRLKTAEVLDIFSGHAPGRAALVAAKSVPVLLGMCEDKSESVRRHIQDTLRNILANPHDGFDVLRDAPNMLDDHLKRLKSADETFAVQVVILNTLHSIIRQNVDAANILLQLKGLDILISKLQERAGGTQLRVALADCIAGLCSFPEGRQAALGREVPKLLAAQLDDHKPEVRAALAGAVMSLSIDVAAKQELVSEDVVATLITLLNDQSESVCLNVLKAIASLSEDYRARFQLQSALPKIEFHSESKNEMIRKAALRALEIVNWRP
ncbi:Radial spoke head 14 [Sorochytrium milnesiophthora]